MLQYSCKLEEEKDEVLLHLISEKIEILNRWGRIKWEHLLICGLS